MLDLREDKQTKKKRMIFGWLSATTGLILLNVSVALLSTLKSSPLGWTLFVAGFAFLRLALRLLRGFR
jgi:hypothetical protein